MINPFHLLVIECLLQAKKTLADNFEKQDKNLYNFFFILPITE